MSKKKCECGVLCTRNMTTYFFSSVKSEMLLSLCLQCFPGQKVDVRYDYELLPSRKPKFLAQTAAHVSGAVYYYQQSDVTDHSWPKKVMLFIYQECKQLLFLCSGVFTRLTHPMSFVYFISLCFPTENVRSVCASKVRRLVCYQSPVGV